MRYAMAAMVVLAGLAPTAGAQDGIDLANQSKSLVASQSKSLSSPPAVLSKQAPFVEHVRDRTPELLLRDELDRRGPRASCETSAADLCFDSSDNRIVYRAARGYMPKIDGFTAESVSLKKDRLLLKYSFK